MIENKLYLIFDMNEKIDSLLLADLKTCGYKLTHMDHMEFDETLTKEETLHETLNRVFHYKGHRKPQVLVITNKEEMLAVAKEMELDTFTYEGVPEALREALINEAELQAIREGAKMPKDGPTATYVKGKDPKAENRPNNMKIIWTFLYPFLLFCFIKAFFLNACTAVLTTIAEYNERVHHFVYTMLIIPLEETGELMVTANGEVFFQIPTLLLSGLAMYLFVGGRKALLAAKEEVKEFKMKNVAMCAGITLAMALGLNFCFAGFGFFKFDASFMEVSKRIYDVSIPAGLILYGIVAPLVEELVFRGIVFNGIKKLVKPLMAAVISAALFAYGHVGFLQVAYAFVIGFMFAYVYHHTNKLYITIIMHSVINLVVYVLGKMAVFQGNTTLGTIGLICAVACAVCIYFKKERP